MAKLRPFRAIRPTRDKAYLVATRPYYMYKKNILEARLEENPYSFLHVINPEFHSGHQSAPNSEERFVAVKNKFQEFFDDGIFKQDRKEGIYVYRQTKGENQYLGIIAGASVEEYLNGSIKKHEETISPREETFTNYLNITGFNAEPVLLFHRQHEQLDLILQILIADRPEYEFTTTEKITHELWVITKKEKIDLIQKCYDQIHEVYIADGHHRSASSARFAQISGAHQDDIGNYFLAFFISEVRLNIIEYNRAVTDLNGMTETEFLDCIRERFEVSGPQSEPDEPRHHSMNMFLGTNWYSIQPKVGSFDQNHPVQRLDTDILSTHLLSPVLGIKDLKTDERVIFIHGRNKLESVESLVRQGKAKVGFELFPVSPAELKAVADAGKIMPPKSTWIEPKLRSGLTIYPLRDD